jgi:hypothetical protein
VATERPSRLASSDRPSRLLSPGWRALATFAPCRPTPQPPSTRWRHRTGRRARSGSLECARVSRRQRRVSRGRACCVGRRSPRRATQEGNRRTGCVPGDAIQGRIREQRPGVAPASRPEVLITQRAGRPGWRAASSKLRASGAHRGDRHPEGAAVTVARPRQTPRARRPPSRTNSTTRLQPRHGGSPEELVTVPQRARRPGGGRAQFRRPPMKRSMKRKRLMKFR